MGERLTAERLGEIRARLAKKFDAGRLTRLQVASIAVNYSLDVEDLLAHIDAIERELYVARAAAEAQRVDELTAENAKLREALAHYEKKP
jgi:hypothetical protein